MQKRRERAELLSTLPSLHMNRVDVFRLPDCRLQHFSCREFWHFGGRDLESLTGPWVSPHPRFALRDRKGPEIHERDALPLLQGRGDGTRKGMKRIPCGHLGDTGGRCHLRNQFFFRHHPLLIVWVKKPTSTPCCHA